MKHKGEQGEVGEQAQGRASLGTPGAATRSGQRKAGETSTPLERRRWAKWEA